MLRMVMTGALALSMMIPIHDADACIHGMKQNRDRDMQLLVRAERALKSGKYKRAFKTARRVNSRPIDVTDVRAKRRRNRVRLGSRHGTRGLVERANRVMAVATIRLDGQTRLARKMPRTAKERLANITWAAHTLRTASSQRPHDAFLKSRLGEALAQTPTGRKEALEILESLAKEDFLADAHGYAAFARLLSWSGDQDGKDEALERCMAMAKKKSICTIKPAQVATTRP